MIMNNISGKIYIGQSKNVFSRWSKHIRESYIKPYDNSILHNAIRKYNISCFWFKILELCDESELDEKEKFYIGLYEATKDNYNISPGGTGGSLSGSKNHNSKLTEDEVYTIRERYKNIERKLEVYNDYKDKLTINTFNDIWTGKTWNHIHMDVYTKENKLKQRKNYDTVKSHEHIRVVSDSDVLKIREFKLKKLKPKHVYETYYNHLNRNTFNDIWYYHTFKHITPINNTEGDNN